MSLTLAVRELCEFTAKRGDLDLRFTPVTSAQEGIAGHAAVAACRGAGYEREISLETCCRELRLRGRADGLQAEPLRLEEIKTFRGDLGRMPDNHRQLHWAQLKIYAAQLCELRGLPELELALVYYDVDHQAETLIVEHHRAEALQQFYDAQCEIYSVWNQAQLTHERARNAALEAMPFPHADFHAGQRQLAEAIYRAAQRQQALLVQAPTGIGKSIGSLFPALKAMARQQVDKIFYLTAKTSGRRSALDALKQLATVLPESSLRVLELVARDKACIHRDKACHGESCPLARGFYDRLPAAREDALAQGLLDQAAVQQVASRHGICPYYLSQDLVRWSDVVVGDYNYYFDQSALLHSLTLVNEWKVAVLVDEAHNLVERGRAMYSAELDQQALLDLRGQAPKALRPVLTRLQAEWNRFSVDQAADYPSYADPPTALADSLRPALAAIGEYFNQNPSALAPELLRFYFDALNYLGLADDFGEHALLDVSLSHSEWTPSTSRVSIRNIVPARYLAPRIAAASAVIAFSATFNPPHYFRDLLGFDAQTPWLDVPSPFSSQQLQVQLVPGISTRYRDRSQSLAPIADLIADQFQRQPGNYLVFASSYDYLRQIARRLLGEHPQLPLIEQAAGMTEAERSAFLDRFDGGSQLIGLAVLGGAFAEGVDLPGRRLIGAFVATLGLPQLNPINEVMRGRMESVFGAESAYDYTYLYPGIQKVVQAVGRVIRTPADRGVVYLIDDRFSQAKVRTLLPGWWFEAADAPMAARILGGCSSSCQPATANLGASESLPLTGPH